MRQLEIQGPVWEEITVGEVVPTVELALTFSKVAAIIATGDFFPGHHNPDYARAQGRKDIYLNTMMLCGFADRVATNWAGPDAFIRSRKFQMTESVYPGDVLVGTGTVAEKYEDEFGNRLVRLDVRLSVDGVPCAGASVLVALGGYRIDPRRSDLLVELT